MIDREYYLDVFNEIYKCKISLNDIDKIMFFDNIFLNLEVKIDEKKYPDCVFFYYGDTIYFEFIKKSCYLYCSYKYVWSVFETRFFMDYLNIRSFIKSRVEHHFKSGPIKPNGTRSIGMELRWNSILINSLDDDQYIEVEQYFTK